VLDMGFMRVIQAPERTGLMVRMTKCSRRECEGDAVFRFRLRAIGGAARFVTFAGE
jgi:hypothetical protein